MIRVAFDGVPMVFLSSNIVFKRKEMCISPACAQWIVTTPVYHRMSSYMVCPCRFHTSGVTFYKWGWLLPNQSCAYARGCLWTDRGDLTRPTSNLIFGKGVNREPGSEAPSEVPILDDYVIYAYNHTHRPRGLPKPRIAKITRIFLFTLYISYKFSHPR